MKKLLFILSFLATYSLTAQDIAMADEMRANGKIYVVVAVLAVIMLGLILYLISIDKKIGSIEKKIDKK